MTRRFLLGLVGPLALALCALAGAAAAADVKVMISAGFFRVYSELGPVFERNTGHRLVTSRGPSLGDSPEAIPARLSRGEAADVLIFDAHGLDPLVARGLVKADSKRDLARSYIGLVVKAGERKPDISSVEALRATLLAAKSIAFSDSSSGTICRASCFRGSALPNRSRARARKCAGRRRASRSPPSWHAARPRSDFSRSANFCMYPAWISSAPCRPRCSRRRSSLAS
jgi:molybdate transport system substrate-binding protein